MEFKNLSHNEPIDSEMNSKDILNASSDIVERQVDTTNDFINENEKYSRSLLEASLDPLVTIGRTGKIKDVNAATEIATGILRDKLIGTDFAEYFTDPNKARAGYLKVFHDGKVIDYELELKNVAGYTTPVLYNASVYKDDEGRIMGVFAAARDITNIKKIENELIFLKNNLELLIKKRAADLVIANKELAYQSGEKSDRAAELVIANKELAYQSGEKSDRAAELVKANTELAFQNIEKDKRAEELIVANIELAYQSSEKSNRAAELVIANRELVYQSGEKDKRAEELNIANIELAYQSAEKSDRAAELVIANKELVYQSGEKDKRAEELIIANIELAYQSAEKSDRAAELAIANKELIYQSGEKEKRAVELINTNKELVIQKDKIKELNDELEIRVKDRTMQLESSNIELEALSYSISHDLKAPVRHIIGYVSLLVKKYGELLPDDGRHYLDTISDAADNMGQLIDGLLQFSRIGRIEINQKLVNMNEIVESMIQPFREQVIERKIEFTIETIPPAYGDIEMMKSVWSNLVENAVKFTQKREVAQISIGAKETKDEIIYYIKDNGAGFDMQYAAKLFAVFQRLHAREDYEGTGVGLATVQRIINRHGGRIWADAKVDEGATFYFTLNKKKGSE